MKRLDPLRGADSDYVVLGLDIAMRNSGLAVVRGEEVLRCFTFKTPSEYSLEETMDEIGGVALSLARKHEPDAIAMEAPAHGSAHVNVSMYHVAGVVRWRLWRRARWPLYLVHNNTLKKFWTGNGRAGKPAMLARARGVFPECPDHNAADALAAAMWGHRNHALLAGGADEGSVDPVPPYAG